MGTNINFTTTMGNKVNNSFGLKEDNIMNTMNIMNNMNIIDAANLFRKHFDSNAAYEEFRTELIKESRRQYIDLYYWSQQGGKMVDLYRASIMQQLEEIEDFFLGDMFDFYTMDLNICGASLLERIKEEAYDALEQPYRRTLNAVIRDYDLERCGRYDSAC